LLGLYECKDNILRKYYEDCRKFHYHFSSVVIEHVPRSHNQEANRLTQSASGYQQIPEVLNNHLADEVED
jgi:hypothetical protein